MATSNVVVHIEGLDALRELVERLEAVQEKIDSIGRPLYGDVHVNLASDAGRFVDAADRAKRRDAQRGI